MKQVHRIDDHRAVGRILAADDAELLDRPDRVVEQVRLPAGHVGRGPVAVDAAHRHAAARRGSEQHRLDQRRLRVVGVDHQRQTALRGRGIVHAEQLKEQTGMLPLSARPRGPCGVVPVGAAASPRQALCTTRVGALSRRGRRSNRPLFSHAAAPTGEPAPAEGRLSLRSSDRPASGSAADRPLRRRSSGRAAKARACLRVRCTGSSARSCS